MTDELKLKVAEAFSQGDIGRSIARIDPKCMDELNLKDGDIIEIEGNKITTATVVESKSDVSLGILRIDSYLRKNAGTSIGEEVTIRPATIKEAKKVKLAPVDQEIAIQGNLNSVFLNRTVNKGDIIITGVRKQQPKTSSMMFDDLINQMMSNMASIGEIKLAVVNTKPLGPVKITENTQIEMETKPVDPSKFEGVENLIDVSYEDIGGLKNEVKKIREMVEIPLKRPELFKQLGISAPKGVLLHGPPGTGKTLLAKAVANESDANFISVKGPELLSKWVGDSEKGIREVFRKARQTAPTVIFFDEIDAIASTRGYSAGDSGVTQRVVNQLLTEMDGMEELHDISVIAATNRKDIIDPALLRPGRFDRHVEVGLPDEESRESIFKVHTKNMPLSDDVDIHTLAKEAEGFVGADIEAVCREAVMLTLRKNLEANIVHMSEFEEAMKKVKPTKDSELVSYN